MIDSTDAKMGRFMKNRENTRCPHRFVPMRSIPFHFVPIRSNPVLCGME
jgi:hypothetical protein